jgi:hypothetical protein
MKGVEEDENAPDERLTDTLIDTTGGEMQEAGRFGTIPGGKRKFPC